MIETSIHFIISLFEILVKFLNDIEITIYGYSFSFYSFFLASILIIAIVGVAINSIRVVGSGIGNNVKHKRSSKYGDSHE